MTGAMYAAISGLKSHMQKLNVIGNNIANINTPGYKSQSCRFTEALYTTLTSGSNGTDIVGGINPSQLGYGCNVGTIDLDMGTGNFVPDGDKLHCMIDGDGFFLVGDKPRQNASGDAGDYTYVETDPASLSLTRVGSFKFDSQGYLTDGEKVVYGFVSVGPAVDGSYPVSTQLVPIRLPQAAGAPAAGATAPAEGSAVFPTLSAAAGTPASRYNVYSDGKVIEVDNVAIDGKTGKITANNKIGGEPLVIGYIPLATVSNPSGVTHIQGAYYQAGEGAGDCTVSAIGSSVKGYLNNVAAAADGAVAIGSTGQTTLQTSGLESSGTDLATEISEMITTQRGYQANTRIITVTDSMLEELVNMKR